LGEICSKKETPELINICTGDTPLNFEARKYAYMELINREIGNSILLQLKEKMSFDFDLYNN